MLLFNTGKAVEPDGLSLNRLKQWYSKIMTEILYEKIEHLEDPSNPSHALCSACGNLQPIENFMRKPSTLQAHQWGWDTKRDMKGRLYVGAECNVCWKKQKNKNSRYHDYNAYDRKLRLSGRYEYKVQHPDNPHLLITMREAMVLAKREQRRQLKVAGGLKGARSRFAGEYKELVRLLENETARAYAQIKRGVRITTNAREYLEQYLDQKAALHPKEKPSDYMVLTNIARRNAITLYNQLTSYERSIVASKYLDL